MGARCVRNALRQPARLQPPGDTNGDGNGMQMAEQIPLSERGRRPSEESGKSERSDYYGLAQKVGNFVLQWLAASELPQLMALSLSVVAVPGRPARARVADRSLERHEMPPVKTPIPVVGGLQT